MSRTVVLTRSFITHIYYSFAHSLFSLPLNTTAPNMDPLLKIENVLFSYFEIIFNL